MTSASVQVTASECLELSDGWELGRSAPRALADAGRLDSLSWKPARVPGTVASALADPRPADDPDAEDWWFRVRFTAPAAGPGEQVILRLGGLATVAEVYLNGDLVLESESMFAAHEIDVGARLQGENELAICCRALAPLLRERRRPRARWRTRLVAEGNLRFYRTMLLGRAPGFAPGPAVVGPWRPVTLERRRASRLDAVRLRARLCDGDGVLDCRAAMRAAPGAALPERLVVEVRGPAGSRRETLAVDAGDGRCHGSVIVPGAEPWWPHTHGRPTLYEVSIGDEERTLHTCRVGFRRLEAPADLDREGLRLKVNGISVFVRGAVWTPLSLQDPHADEDRLRPILQRVTDCGMNMLRVPGTAAYESEDFYALCDEMGILVWQDFMFANLDYPEQDATFMKTVDREARSLLDRLGSRPSLAVLCGSSEVAQQVAMLGLDPGLADGPLYGELLPALVAEAGVEAPYLPSTPWGGDLAFRPDRGVANYYGVGAYLRPLEDARRSNVRFAGECLAFANVPDDAALGDLEPPYPPVTHPAWKAGVPRDTGAGWDFDDVRDHYLRRRYDVDPTWLRSVDQERYLELSRLVTGDVMAEVFAEWRRTGSPCRGALVLWLKDLLPGAGWGILDHRGEPKAAYHMLRRALAPVAVWSTDEGLGGIDIHLANDSPQPVAARLRIALYRDFQVLVGEAAEEVGLGPRSSMTRNLEAVLGRFVDAAWAYRFGPPAQDLIAVSLERASDDTLISQIFRFPAGRPLERRSAEDLGLHAALAPSGPGELSLSVSSVRFVDGVRIQVPGFEPADDVFGIEPGRRRIIALRRRDPRAEAVGGWLTAVNLHGRLRLEPSAAASQAPATAGRHPTLD